MADDRISRDTAELIPMPPHTWYVKTLRWLLEQPKVKDNIKNVPLNELLSDSVFADRKEVSFGVLPPNVQEELGLKFAVQLVE